MRHYCQTATILLMVPPNCCPVLLPLLFSTSSVKHSSAFACSGMPLQDTLHDALPPRLRAQAVLSNRWQPTPLEVILKDLASSGAVKHLKLIFMTAAKIWLLRERSRPSPSGENTAWKQIFGLLLKECLAFNNQPLLYINEFSYYKREDAQSNGINCPTSTA